MKRDVEFLTNFPNFVNWLNNPNLVIHHHDGNQTRIGTNRGPELTHVNQPVFLDGEIRDLVTLLLEVAARIEDTLVLRLGGDDVALGRPEEVKEAFDGDVVGLGGAGGEDDFLRGGVDEGGDLGAGGFDGGFGFPAVEVGPTMGVAVLGDEIREHGVEDTGVHR